MTEELIRSYGLDTLFIKNSPKIKIKIIQIMNTQPSETDFEGFVYGYKIFSDTNTKSDFRIKLGRTGKENPADRVRQWGGEMEFCCKTIYNKRLERLIHLFFRYANIIKIRGDGHKEIEWFHFKEKININKYVSILNEMVGDLYESNTIKVKSSPATNLIEEIKKININTAGLHLIGNLAGIGPKLSDNIIKYRINNGPFKTIRDILKCPGIGIARFTKIENHIYV